MPTLNMKSRFPLRRQRKLTIKKNTATIANNVGFRISKTFESVLSQPFPLWNDLDNVVGEAVPEWSPTERSYIIQHLIQFLETKVMIEEFTQLQFLSPTKLVARAWQALILNTHLYKKVTFDIQDFHQRPRQMLHHSLVEDNDHRSYQQRLDRTQHLFQANYNGTMPESVDDIDSGRSLADASALTEANLAWFLPRPPLCQPLSTPPVDRQNTLPDVINKTRPKSRIHWLSRLFCLDSVRETFFCANEDQSLEGTVLLDDIDDEKNDCIITNEHIQAKIDESNNRQAENDESNNRQAKIDESNTRGTSPSTAYYNNCGQIYSERLFEPVVSW